MIYLIYCIYLRELLDKAVKRLSNSNPYKQKSQSSEYKPNMPNLDSVFDEVLAKSLVEKQDPKNNNHQEKQCERKNDLHINKANTEEQNEIGSGFPSDVALCLKTLIEVCRFLVLYIYFW